MENVYNIEKSPIFEEVLTIFKSAGYGITKHVWDASYMEVPQMRRRYFVVGKLGEKDDFLLEKIVYRRTQVCHFKISSAQECKFICILFA